MTNIAAVIRISDFNESPYNALTSLAKFADKYISSIWIIGSDKERVGPQLLAPFGNIQVTFPPTHELDVMDLPRDTHVILEVPPTCYVKEPAIRRLVNQMNISTPSQTHFCIKTVTVLDDDTAPRLAFLAYGLLLVELFFSWLWSLFEFRKLFQTLDVNARFIITKGKHRHVATRSIFWRFYNWGSVSASYGGAEAIIIPKFYGMNYVLYVFHNHRHFTWGFWPIWFSIYYYTFAFPWWTFVLPNGTISSLLFVNAFHPIWIILFATHFLVNVMVIRHYIKFKHMWIIAFFYPVYLALFPFVLVYARIYQPTEKWTTTPK